MLNTRERRMGGLLAVILAALVISCLFSSLLPSSASLLAPTPTQTRTMTSTPSATPTSTSTPIPSATLTHLPPELITSHVTEVGLYPLYTSIWKRTLWEEQAGATIVVEGFEYDSVDFKELVLPYTSANQFVFNGKSHAQMLNSTDLLPSVFLHFRDWEQGLTITFPNSTPARAFGFNYTTNEEWRLTFHNAEIVLPRGRNMFVGILLDQDFQTQFTLVGSSNAQGGLSIDNISYIP